MNEAHVDTMQEQPGSQADLRTRLSALLAATAGNAPADAEARYFALRAELEAFAYPQRRALLTSALAWTGQERHDADWLHRACDDLASIGYQLATRAAARLGDGDVVARDLAAAALFYLGETVKWDVSVVTDAPHDMRKVHGLMVLAMRGNRQREPLSMVVDGRSRECNIEALYFRALLLARFASGVLNAKQMEILDAWMWMWTPVLAGVETPPAGTALRADLDSVTGLQLGPRPDAGPSLYLPSEPIAAAYREIVARFHAGRMVPDEGIASEFRIEEHVAVLNLLRRNLRQSRKEPGARAARRSIDRPVELFVGLAEILKRGFAPASPEAAHVGLAAVDGGGRAMRTEREFDALPQIYDVEHRSVRMLDESDTGFGLEAASADVSGVAAGDLVGVRVDPDAPMVLGKVVRSMAARAPGRSIIGVRRLVGAPALVDVRVEPGAHAGHDDAFLFLAGRDSSGRQDGMLVAERDFVERAPIVVGASDREFRLRFNRARERGRGWVLAGFEVASARPVFDIEIA